MRAALAALIVLATVGFVVGTSIERGEGHHESAVSGRAEGAAEAHVREVSHQSDAA